MKKWIALWLTALMLTGCAAETGENPETGDTAVQETRNEMAAEPETEPEVPETEPEVIEEIPIVEENPVEYVTVTEPGVEPAEAVPVVELMVSPGQPGTEVYTDFTQVLWEDENYRLAVRDGIAGVYTADGRLYTAFCPMEDGPVFVPEKSGLLYEEKRREDAWILSGLRFAFRTELEDGGTLLTEYTCTEHGWYTYFTAEVPEDHTGRWYFFREYGAEHYEEMRDPHTNCWYGIYTLYCIYTPETAEVEMQKLNYDNTYILRDGAWYFYTPADGEKTLMDFMPENGEYISRVMMEDGTLLGYNVANTDGKHAYYDLEAGKYLTDFEMQNFSAWAVGDTYVICQRDADPDTHNGFDFTDGLLHRKTGEILGFDRPYGNVAFTGRMRDGHVYFLSSDWYSTGSSVWVYTEDMKPISEEQFLFPSITEDGNLLVIPSAESENCFRIYSPAGELIRTSAAYDKILFTCRDWVVVVQDGKLQLIDAEENPVVTFDDWTEDMFTHTMLSGYKEESMAASPQNDPWDYHYFERNEDGEYVEKETDTYPAGIYFLTEDGSVDYGVTGRAKEYFWCPDTGLTGMLAWGEVGGYAKPVLYLYPEETTDVTVTFARPEILTTVYPAYGDGWQVTVSPDGTMTNGRDREYYALYWEESGYVPVDFSEGFCVAGEAAAAFLEEKLDALGLTNREANEMIMYWLPVLEKNEFSLVYFELTESREAYNRLQIDPVPDSMLRIAIHIKAADAPVEMAEQRLPMWEREGFAAVEWGGAVHP